MIHGSRTPKEDRDEARTPDWLFRWLDERWHFDVDLAASVNNSKCPFSYGIYCSALSKYAIWSRSSEHAIRKYGFCNPPYSNIKPWFEKAFEESKLGFTTIFVVPTPNGEEHYKLVEQHASELIFIHGRINFLRQDGTEIKGNPRGTCIIVFAPNRTELKVSWVDRDTIRQQYESRR